jgi:hypothetical protein
MSNCSGNNPYGGNNPNRRKGYYYRREIQPFEPDFTGNFWDISGTSIYNTNGCGEGYVGIGNSNPQYNLDVSGILNVSNRIITYGISAEIADLNYIIDVVGSPGYPSASTLVLGSTPSGIKWIDVSAGGGGGSLPTATQWSEYIYYNTTIGAYQVGGGSGDSNRLHLASGAGQGAQGTGAIALGFQAGQTNQGIQSIAIGVQAGTSNQGANAVAIGYQAGISGEKSGAIAIGYQAGAYNQGTNSIAIGNLAGRTNQLINSIIINATGVDLSSIDMSGLYIAPIRQGRENFVLTYNTNNKEIRYTNDLSLNNLDISNRLRVNDLSATKIYTNDLSAINVLIVNLDVSQANIKDFSSNKIFVRDLSAVNANITNLYSNNIDGSFNIIDTNDTNTYYPLFTQGVGYQKLRIDTNKLIYNPGLDRLGINRDPSYNLDLSGSFRTTTIIDRLLSSGANGQVLTSTITGIEWKDVSGSGGGGTNYWTLTSGGADIFNNNGNVGIGTGTVSSIPYKLDVSGETRIQSTNIRYGIQAGHTSQGSFGIAIGYQAGQGTQASGGISIGYNAGLGGGGVGTMINGQGTNAIAIGTNAGGTRQLDNAIAIGTNAGQGTQSSGAIAIGYNAGLGGASGTFIFGQGSNAIAIGVSAGTSKQGTCAIAIGDNAGSQTQGQYAIAMGYYAGRTNQTANSIIINATGTDLSSMDVSGLFIAPIRRVTGITQALYYNTSTKEIVYSDVSGSGSSGTNYWTLTSGGVDIFNNNNSNNGNVGIGTGTVSSIPYKLDVSGETRIQSINVRYGIQAGNTNQGSYAIAIGYQAGLSGENINAISIGYQAGQANQGVSAVAIGSEAGLVNQGATSIAIGSLAGKFYNN